MSDSSPTRTWIKADLTTPESRLGTIARCAPVFREDPRSQMTGDLVWLFSGGADHGERATVYLCCRGDEVVGYTPLLGRDSRLGIELLGLSLGSVPVQRLTLVGCPLFRNGVRAQEEALIIALLRELGDDLTAREVLFFLGLRADSALFALAAENRPLVYDFHVLPHGPAYQRRLVAMPGSFARPGSLACA